MMGKVCQLFHLFIKISNLFFWFSLPWEHCWKSFSFSSYILISRHNCKFEWSKTIEKKINLRTKRECYMTITTFSLRRTALSMYRIQPSCSGSLSFGVLTQFQFVDKSNWWWGLYDEQTISGVSDGYKKKRKKKKELYSLIVFNRVLRGYQLARLWSHVNQMSRHLKSKYYLSTVFWLIMCQRVNMYGRKI